MLKDQAKPKVGREMAFVSVSVKREFTRYNSISLNGTNKPQRFYNESPFYTFLQSSL